MIEGTDVYEYFLCPYKVYNRHNTDKSLMIPLPEFTKHLLEQGRNHEKELVASIKASRPIFPFKDFEKGFLETLKLMKKKAEFIHQGVLIFEDHLGIPDLLIKQKGKSKLGKHFYIAADVKLSSKSKEEQIMQLLFYDMLLGKTQGFSSNKGILILRNCSEMIDLTPYKEEFESSLTKIRAIINGLDYGLHIDSVCKDCPWKNVCFPLAEKRKDVSLVYSLSRHIHYKLLEQGIKTVKDLVEIDTEKLAELSCVNEGTALRWKDQAEVVLSKKDKIMKIDLPETKNHICLDIETSEDGFVYLIGLWHNNKFVHFFSEKNEKNTFEDFIEYLLSLKDYRLYHYGTFEKTVFRQIFEKYNIDENIRHEIFSRMTDLFQLVKKYAILPLNYYNLKDVAKHFGFKWRASDASGGNSMIWYDEWVKNKDKKLLKKILEYNEDDVKATSIVLEKLRK